MRVVDTNVLLHAVNEDSEYRDSCLRYLQDSRYALERSFLTWSICYEFMRVASHPSVLNSPMTMRDAWSFLESLLASPRFSILTHTELHESLLIQTMTELPALRGNIAHDLHTAVLMREHSVNLICTFDNDFRRFPFLTVIDPFSEPLQ